MDNVSALAGDVVRGEDRRQSDIAPAVVQAALARILASPDFDASEHNRRFLRYVIEEALAEARKIEERNIIYNHVVLAMAYAKVGRTREAATPIEQIVALDPAYGSHVVADLQKRNVHPDVIEAVVEGLSKAGLAVNDTMARTAPDLRRGASGGALVIPRLSPTRLSPRSACRRVRYRNVLPAS